MEECSPFVQPALLLLDPSNVCISSILLPHFSEAGECFHTMKPPSLFTSSKIISLPRPLPGFSSLILETVPSFFLDFSRFQKRRQFSHTHFLLIKRHSQSFLFNSDSTLIPPLPLWFLIKSFTGRTFSGELSRLPSILPSSCGIPFHLIILSKQRPL